MTTSIWVITSTTQSIEEGTGAVTTSHDVLAVATTHSEAEDYLDSLGPSIRGDVIHTKIQETSLIGR